MSLIFICIFAISFIYTLFIQFLCMEDKKARHLAVIFKYTSVAGAALSAVSFIIYYVNLLTLDNNAFFELITDTFSVFIIPTGIFAFIIIAMSLAIHFIGKKTSGAIPSVCHLGSIIILLYTLICASWSDYEQFPLALYINLMGIGISAITLSISQLTISRLAKNLGDREFLRQRKYGSTKRKEKAAENKRIRETKKRIKSGTKK